ncbi:MAG: hypothetical protein K2M46_06470 [Lachnospiraceae bacterium]|nr:hypothetical protein [Lachnospiraceae bacterium]
MNREIGSYGKIMLTCIVAGVVATVFFGIGRQVYEKSKYSAKETAENISEDMRMLAAEGKYPFFVGSQYLTITRNYQGSDGLLGFSREDALSFVKAYEYIKEDGQEQVKEISQEKIRVYPFDDESTLEKTLLDVSTTGKYTVRYSVEGESGLKADMVMLVLVDILPEGQEYWESGAENESSH